MMEGQDLSSPNVDTSRPSLGFPLGTALLLILLFSLSGIFSCCYHWDKLRSLRRQSLEAPDTLTHTQSQSQSQSQPSKSKPHSTELKEEKKGQSLPVLMPGDKVPKFIAMPCPCQPWRTEEIIVSVEKPPPEPP